jgi:hypothetical protein
MISIRQASRIRRERQLELRSHKSIAIVQEPQDAAATDDPVAEEACSPRGP